MSIWLYLGCISNSLPFSRCVLHSLLLTGSSFGGLERGPKRHIVSSVLEWKFVNLRAFCMFCWRSE